MRGTLFVPKGSGPFPVVIELYGVVGGVEFRTSLLASRGFMSLALSYDGFQLADNKVIDLGCIEEAKEFLESRPEVDCNNIGILGLSFGGMLALSCMSCIPGFKCVISVNGPVFTYLRSVRYKDHIWHAKLPNFDKGYEMDGAVVLKYSLDEEYDVDRLGSSLIDFANWGKPFLIIFGDDDNALNNQKSVSFIKKITKNGKGNYKIAMYPGAGHLLELPYSPHVRTMYLKLASKYHHWGGVPKQHARAQRLSWSEMLSFLKRHLSLNINAKL